MIGTPEYQLAKFLDSIIKSYIPDSYMLHSTDHFLDELNNFQFKADHKLVSFDVQSLFTNVPLDETINIIADYIYSKDNQIKDNLPSMKKEVFIKLLRLANQGIILSKNKLYQQHYGVSIGSPLAPTLANFFLAHNNIKFTVELPSDTIPFLDVEIRLNETGIDTWVYRKPTNTNLILNFNALCPTKWKSGLILCFLNRAKRICSSDFLFDKEVSMLKKMFLNNG